MPRHEVRYAIDIEQEIAQALLERRPWSEFTNAWNAAIENLAVNPEQCKHGFLEGGTFAYDQDGIWIQFTHFPLDMRVIILHVTWSAPRPSPEAN